jgi:hypothetical protein
VGQITTLAVSLNLDTQGSPLRGTFKTYLMKSFRYALQRETQRLIHRNNTEQNYHTDPTRRHHDTDDPDEPAGAELRTHATSLCAKWRSEKRRRRVRETWATITERIFIDERSVHETAAELNISEQSVRNILSRYVCPEFRRIVGFNPDGPSSYK